MIKRIEHIGILVNNLEASVPLYEALLGVKPDVPPPFPSGMKIANYELPGGGIIELMSPAPGSDLEKSLRTMGESIHHVCLEVDDVDAELVRAEKAGAQLMDRKARGTEKMKIGFLKAGVNAGVVVEYIQRSA